MKPYLLLSFILGLPIFAHADYICKINGKAAFSSTKINSSCVVSQMDGISDEPTAASASSTNQDEISRLWAKERFGSYDDVVIVPPESISAPAPKMNVKLRQAQATPAPIRRAPAPIRAATYTPSMTPPKLGRQQILQREIAAERQALSAAQTQLAKLKKQGGNITALQQVIRDREANIQALQRELTNR